MYNNFVRVWFFSSPSFVGLFTTFCFSYDNYCIDINCTALPTARASIFKPEVGIKNNMLCLLPGPQAYYIYIASAFQVHSTSFSPNLSKQKSAKCLELRKDFDL